MKITYYDLFDLIAEDAGILLAQSEDSVIRPDLCDINETVCSVMKRAGQPCRSGIKKKTQKRKRIVRLLIAAVVILSASGIAFAAYQYELSKDGAALITDENRDLIGKDAYMEGTVYDKYGNWVSGPLPAPEPALQDILAGSRIITGASDTDTNMLPNSISYFPTEQENAWAVTPEVIFENGSMIVFTKADSSGWHLSAGDTLVFKAEEYPLDREPNKNQIVGFCHVFNHKLINDDIFPLADSDLKYELTAEKDGEYYICLINGSSEPISLKEGKIYIRTKT